MSASKESMAKAYAYYKDRQYEDNEGMTGMFGRTQEIFNKVPSIVEKMQQFTLKGFSIEPPERLRGLYEENNELNGYYNLYEALVKRVVLYEETFIEVVPTNEGEYINIIDKDMVSNLKKDNGKIKYAVITGKTEFGEDIVKEYLNGFFKDEETGKEKFLRGFRIKKGDEDKTFHPTEDMRLLHIPKCYTIKTIFNKIDRVNEFEYFIYAMGRANGDPKLFSKKLTELTDEVKEEFEKFKEKYNLKEKMIMTDEEEADMKYIELQGKIIPHFQKQIETTKTEIKEEFPESALTLAMLGSNISEDTTRTKILEVSTKVQKIRKSVGDALQEALRIIFKSRDMAINYEELQKKDTDGIIKTYSELHSLGVISLQTFQEKLAELGIISSFEDEKKKIQEEGSGLPNPYPNLEEE